jgi:hypothetical protein
MKLAANFGLPTIKAPTAYGGAFGTPIGLGDLLNNVFSSVLVVAGLLLIAYLMFGGFKYITAGGDDKALGEAKKMIMNAMVGLVIVAVAYFIALIAGTVLGIDIMNPVFKGPGKN